MEDREFCDFLYSGWAKTTGGDDSFWMPEEYTDHSGRWNIYSISGPEQDRKLVASSVSADDSAFIVAAHGSMGDLIRRLHDALDEADRLDEEKDDLVVESADREMEIDRLNARVQYLEDR